MALKCACGQPFNKAHSCPEAGRSLRSVYADTPRRFVVCAAIRKGERIICGARHMDAIMRQTIDALQLLYTGWEQGFIDQHGVFMTREEAWRVADKEGQLRRPYGIGDYDLPPRKANVGDEGVLFSEHLY